MAECTKENCPFRADIESLQKEIVSNKEQHREFYQKLNESNVKIALAEERYNNLLSLINEIKTTLNELKDKPTRRWEQVIMCLISAIVGLVISLLFKGI